MWVKHVYKEKAAACDLGNQDLLESAQAALHPTERAASKLSSVASASAEILPVINLQALEAQRSEEGLYGHGSKRKLVGITVFLLITSLASSRETSSVAL